MCIFSVQLFSYSESHLVQ